MDAIMNVRVVCVLYVTLLFLGLTTCSPIYKLHMLKHCDKTEIGIYTTAGVSLKECVNCCSLRPACGGLRYFRSHGLCVLRDKSTNTNQSIGATSQPCVNVERNDILVAPTCLCEENEVCVQTGDVYSCMITECTPVTSVTHGKIYGNVYEVRSKLVYSCDTDSKMATENNTLICLPSGQWNQWPTCILGSHIGMGCSPTKPCLDPNAICVFTHEQSDEQSVCFCHSTYKYDVETRTCVKRCTRVDDTFDLYDKIRIHGYNQWTISTSNIEECKKACINKPECFHIEDWTAKRPKHCNLGLVSYQIVKETRPIDIYDASAAIYSRRCT